MTFSANVFDNKPTLVADPGAHPETVLDLTSAEQELVGGGATTTEYAILIGL